MAQASEADTRDRMRYLEERVQILEEEKTIRDEAARAASAIALGGLVEFEYAADKDFNGESSSDMAVATVELAAEAQINEWTRAAVVYLFEEDATEPGEIDQAILTFGNPEASPFYLSGGRMYVPFGNFETGMVSDPLTLELGETRESALQVGFESNGLYGSLYAFNGDIEDDDNDKVQGSGLNLGYALDGEGYSLDLGASYISNLADSDGLQDHFDEGIGGAVADEVAGIGAHVIYATGPWMFIGEYVGAGDRFDAAELPFDGNGAKPTAWNLEFGYGFELMGREATLTLGHQRTTAAVALELPEARSLAALSVAVMENAAISFEYAHDSDYGSGDGGSGETGHTYTLHLAAEF